MLAINNEQDFKDIPKLRWHIDEDLTPIAKTIRKKLAKDHLYFHGSGVLGIYYERDNKQKARNALKYWISTIGVEIIDKLVGTCDGILLFKPKEISDIPKVFFRGEPRGDPDFFSKA